MTVFTVASLYQWPRHATPKAREIVLGIVNASKTPLATKDIYNLAVKPRSTPAPHANETIRSIRYLKTVVLRDLAAQKRIEKVRVQGAYTAWLWRPTQASPVPTQRASVPPTPTPTPTSTSTLANPGSMALTPAAVGVGEDWSHLNKRRQRARRAKVERDVRRMREVQKMQRGADAV